VVGAHVENTGLQPVHRLDVKHASALDNAGTVWEPLSHEQEPRLSHHCSSEVLLSTLPERGPRGEDDARPEVCMGQIGSFGAGTFCRKKSAEQVLALTFGSARLGRQWAVHHC